MERLANRTLEATIDPCDLTVAVRDLRTGIVWRMQTAGPGDIGIKGHGGPWQGLPFSAAGSVVWEGNASRRRAVLSKWPYRPNVWSPMDFVVEVAFELRRDVLSVTVSTKNGRGEASLIDGYYPRGFLLPGRTGGALVLPYGQGCLLDTRFPCELDHTLPAYAGMGFVMGWWGHLADSGEGVAALVDTPDDLGVRLVTEPGAGHTAHPFWQASLGNFRYPRRISYRFFDRADAVVLAKAYRTHAAERGLAVTLKDKAKEKPAVGTLRGSVVVNIWHESWFGNFRKKDVWRRMSFAEGLRRFTLLEKDAGIERAVVHVDGWGAKGYDCLHPDILPPDPKLGGWPGLRAMADGVRKGGHLFLLHDNYVDIYADSPSFRDGNTVLDLSGVRPENNEWLGGRQQWLCPVRTMGYAKRNLSEVRRRVRPSATYLDCFTYSHLRECHDQRHLCSRADARKAWSEIFALCGSYGWATSSEGGADWAVPVLDFCHTVAPGNAPFDLRAKLGGPLGVPIPLYGLVWHDCVVVPSWVEQDRPRDSFLWGLLWGGIPSVRPRSFDCAETPYSPEAPAFVRSLAPMVELSRRVGFEELCGLEMLDSRGRNQRTSFADGTRVTVSFDEGSYRIERPGRPPVEGRAPCGPKEPL